MDTNPSIHNRFGDLRREDTCVLLPTWSTRRCPANPGRRAGEQKCSWTNGLVAASVHPHDIQKPKGGLAMPAGAMAGVRGWGSCQGEGETATAEPTRSWGAQWLPALADNEEGCPLSPDGK